MPTILLVEDEADSLALAQRAFRKSNVPQPKVVNDGEVAIAYLNGDGDYANRSRFPLPDLILLDLNLPKKNGFEVLEWLRAQPSAAIKHIPVVILTTRQTPDEMKLAYDLGARLYLVKPLTAKSLGDSIDRLVLTFDPPQRIMICDDDPDHRAFVEGELHREFPQAHIEHIADMESFVDAIDLGPFDLVITELRLKSLNGLTVLRTVKAHWAFCAVIMITGHGDEESAVEAMKAGLDDYVLKSPEHFIRFNNAVHTALSRVSARRAKLRAEEKYRALVEQVPAIIYTAALGFKSGTIYVSPQIEITGYNQEEWMANPNLWLDSIHPDDREQTLEAIHRTFTNHEPFIVEYRLIARGGRTLWIRDEGRVVTDADGKPLHLQGVMLDVTERKHAEEEIERRANQFAALYEIANDIASEQDLYGLLTIIVERATRLLKATGGGLYLYEASQQEVVFFVAQKVSVPVGARLKLGEGLAGKVAQTRQAMIVNNYQTWEGRSPKYNGIPTRAVVEVPMIYRGELIGVLVVEESIDLKRAFSQDDARLLTLFAAQAASAVRHARLLEETKRRADEFSALLETTRDISAQQENLSSLLQSIVDRAVDLLQAYSGMLYLYDPATQDLELMVERNSWGQVGMRLKLGEGLAGRVAQTREPLSVDNYQKWEGRSPQLNGLPIAAVMGVPLLYGGELIGALVIAERGDEADRKFTEADSRLLTLFAAHVASALHRAKLREQMEQQLRRLETLHNIEVTINSTFDLRLMLNIVLEHVAAQLGVDAADILLFNATTQTLSYFTGRGFRAQMAQGAPIKMGAGFAGKAAMSRSTVVISDLKTAPPDLTLNDPRNLNAEGFMAYCGVPLLAKGVIKGVLEVFHRAPFAPESEWLDFLEAVGTQTTIAIDNIQLFDNLQRANTNLNLSYDETLKSWARISDQRAHRDEDYTRRATDLTLLLAQTLGVKDTDLTQLRHGALLHDVGSLLIPDAILLKADSLTAEEQALIRHHPEHSRQILSTIRQLQLVLDIPLYHHERWDGSGYPHGLTGEQIPLAARIFAVVNVWMAVRSARPYRAAWSETQARDYLRAMAGVQFDLKVVETFLIVIAAMDSK